MNVNQLKGVWAVVKGEVARSGPHPNLLAIRNKLLYSFKEKVNSQVITGLWRKTIRIAKDYVNSDDNSFLVNDEIDNDCEIDNNFSLEDDVEFD